MMFTKMFRATYSQSFGCLASQARVFATFAEHYERHSARKFTSIVATSPLIQKRFDTLNNSTIAVMNYPIVNEFSPLSWKEKQSEVCYTGLIAQTSGLDTLLDSLNHCKASRIRLNLAGRYSPESYRTTLAQKRGWRRVNEFGTLGRKDVADVIRRSKVGIALSIEARSTAILSTKMFEYMAAGVPVIVSNIPSWKEIVDEHQCEICVNPLDPMGIADAIHYLTSNEKIGVQMGMNGRRAVETCFNWETEFAKLIRLYTSIHPQKSGLFSKSMSPHRENNQPGALLP